MVTLNKMTLIYFIMGPDIRKLVGGLFLLLGPGARQWAALSFTFAPRTMKSKQSHNAALRLHRRLSPPFSIITTKGNSDDQQQQQGIWEAQATNEGPLYYQRVSPPFQSSVTAIEEVSDDDDADDDHNEEDDPEEVPASSSSSLELLETKGGWKLQYYLAAAARKLAAPLAATFVFITLLGFVINLSGGPQALQRTPPSPPPPPPPASSSAGPGGGSFGRLLLVTAGALVGAGADFAIAGVPVQTLAKQYGFMVAVAWLWGSR